MEYDLLDCNITANVFLLLFFLIYHPLQSQQVHLRGQVSFAVRQWKISVEGSISHGFPTGVTALAWALPCPAIAAFYNLAVVIFNFFASIQDPYISPGLKILESSQFFPTDLGTCICWLSSARYWFPESKTQLRTSSQKKEILEDSPGQFIDPSPLSHGCSAATPHQLNSTESTPKNSLRRADKIVLLAVRKG